MSDIVIGAGDRLPIIERTVTVDGDHVNITGGTVVFAVYDPADMSVVLSEAATVHQASQGIVQYSWSAAAAATLTAGNYFARFIVSLGSQTLTAPNDGYLTILVSGAGTGSFTYSGNPDARALDALRFMIHDTDATDPLMMDAELLWLIQECNSVYQAAHDACYILAGRFARQADISKSVGDLSLSITYSNRSAQYTELADKFMELAARREVPQPWANPQNLKATADRLVQTRDSDFWLGQTDYR